MGVRVYELAKELGCSSRELVQRLQERHILVKGHMSALDEETAEIIRHEFAAKKGKATKTKSHKEQKPPLKKISIAFPFNVRELAAKLKIGPADLIAKLAHMKVMAGLNEILEFETARCVGIEFGFDVEKELTDEDVLLAKHRGEDDKAGKEHRPPVVTLMGHVDHGKTSLLDVIRKSNITVKESGGITQHIGAYQVDTDRGKVVFLDTPGHEAFTSMRARGANITDIVIIVIAADDGVMPQTVEAINHAKDARVPIVVAINKIDLPGADIDKVNRQLAELELTPEDWGGKTITVKVSAKEKKGIDQLLEMILLEAELLELKANPKSPARGMVIESKLSKGSGPTATMLVQNGTLHIQDVLVCGKTYGKIRAMANDWGERIQDAGPSIPVEVYGLSEVPQVGDAFYVVADEKKAKELCAKKSEELRQKRLVPAQRMSLEQIFQKAKEGELKDLKLIIKTDVQGSLEALTTSLEQLNTKDIAVKIIHAQVGNVSESDVMLAVASNAVIIGFHVGVEAKVKEIAEQKQIDVRLYRIIYEVINDVRLSMEGLLEPTIKEIFIGKGKVLQMFNISGFGAIAGCVLIKGKFLRTADLVRLFRNEQRIYEGKFSSLKRYKDDVKEVGEGLECGIALDKFSNIESNDIIECYRIEKVARKL
ncbi:MAG: translation initiation factor IF-2 [Candidatus Omnitrophica bacterium]|nr:translation initiation factor IF-2 [Candidatus Omnitrophota bacterium]MBU1924428.1 translation initiation factor IF-2 [Candidatus Omnitrophota bacterium]